MSVGSVLIGLQASWRNGRGVTTAEFLEPLAIQPDEVEAVRADGGEWASGMVYIAVIRDSQFDHIDSSQDAGAPSEAFYAAVVAAFRGAGRFLDQRSPAITAGMMAAGLSLRLFVDVRMNDNQMELELPPDLLAACGRHGIGIFLISNDIPAAEVLASNSRE